MGVHPAKRVRPFLLKTMPIGVYKRVKKGGMSGKKHTPETIEKLRKSHLGQVAWNKGMKGAYKQTEKARENIRIGQQKRMLEGRHNFFKGHTHSEETRLKLSLAHANDKSWKWKGDEAGYRSKHIWIRKWRGASMVCEICGEEKHIMHWANIDHKYRRVLKDYLRLCPKCHGEYDKLNGLRKHKVNGTAGERNSTNKAGRGLSF